MARHWIDAGARRIHVVDLDGAFAGKAMNAQAVEAIVNAVDEVPVQLGGGIRSTRVIDAWLELGLSQVIVGTFAVEEADRFRSAVAQYPDQIILGVDARNGKVATRGWAESTELDSVEFISRFSDLPLHAVVYTDIDRDGMLVGVNWNAMRTVLNRCNLNLVASGGVHGMNDLLDFKTLAQEFQHLIGLISGSALYEGKLDFMHAQRVLES